MANTYISRTQANGTSAKKFTASIWFKRSPVTNVGNQPIWSSSSSTGDALDLLLAGNGEINFEDVNGNAPKFVTTRKLRDPSAWYHVVVAVDSTQATDTNRVKIYLNGVQETVFGTANYPTQNMDFAISTSADTMKFGSGGQSPSNYFNGVMSHVNFTDGYVYQASEFGETDSTTGEWKIKTSPSVTYGINGCFILKDGNSVTDQSGNSNNFTVGGGTLTNTEDCPDNVFATFNPLDTFYTTPTFTNGNTTLELNPSGSKDTYVPTTLGMSSGKYYTEAKFISGVTYTYLGIVDKPATASKIIGDFTNSVRLRGDDGTTRINNVASTTLTSFTTNDIIGIAVDLTNLKIYYSKNGVWMNSANPSSGTGGLTITAPDGAYFFAWQCNSGSSVCKYSWNFGNGTFGTTAIASAGTNASNNGVFEYDVPTGYTALSTKGLNA
jgi:hypothetical protein